MMICPYCNYKTGWDKESLTNVNGKYGNFYKPTNNIKLERKSCIMPFTNLCGCPNCKKVFIN